MLDLVRAALPYLGVALLSSFTGFVIACTNAQSTSNGTSETADAGDASAQTSDLNRDAGLQPTPSSSSSAREPRPSASGGLPAFPGAEGFGVETPGGRGGAVIVVTTLDYSGPGSFAEALYTEAPRIIVFEVSGVIEVPEDTDDLLESHSYLTVAGQTSPGGITLRGGGAALTSYRTGFHDGVFRHLRFRSQGGYDNISLNQVHHVVFDHCDFSGAEDESFDITFSSDFTVQWSTIMNSGPEGQQYGQLLAYEPTTRISLHHNLSAHHVSRCGPHMHWDEGSAPPEGALVDYRNNVIYDCVSERALNVRDPPQGSLRFNLVGNTAIAGPNTPETAGLFDFGPAASVYESDNHYDPTREIWKEWSEPVLATNPHSFPEVTTHNAVQALDLVLERAGAWPRDPMNVRTVREVRERSGSLGATADPLIDDGPGPPPDQDGDGMSNAWEEARGLDPSNPGDASDDPDGDGYTNIEEYINDLANDIAPNP